MPNVQNKIIEHLRNDHDTELMRHELESMLERELAKPESEVDVQLVDELLAALEAEEPAETEKQITWNAIEDTLQHERRQRRIVALHRAAACIAALIVLSFATVGTAKAFNWTFLLKLLAPVAETFGIHNAGTADFTTNNDSAAVYTVEDVEAVQIQYTSEAEFPEEWDGFRVQPAWLPERFSFVDGSVYDDGSVAVLNVTYMGGEDFLNLNTTFFADAENVFSFEYERTLEVPVMEDIAGRTVTFYHNLDEEQQSASWIDCNVHYSIVGNLTEAEIKQIISSLVEQ